jgi:predicted nucleotidyltransferase
VADHVDEAVREVVAAAARSLALRRAILFGSRARADARPDSDIDLAFEHDSSDAEWASFVNAMADAAPTLLRLDLVDLSRVEPLLRSRILSEGQPVHG